MNIALIIKLLQVADQVTAAAIDFVKNLKTLSDEDEVALKVALAAVRARNDAAYSEVNAKLQEIAGS